MTYPSHVDCPDKTPVRFRAGLSFLKTKLILVSLCMPYRTHQSNQSNSLAVMTYPSHVDCPDKTPVQFRVGLLFSYIRNSPL